MWVQQHESKHMQYAKLGRLISELLPAYAGLPSLDNCRRELQSIKRWLACLHACMLARRGVCIAVLIFLLLKSLIA